LEGVEAMLTTKKKAETEGSHQIASKFLVNVYLPGKFAILSMVSSWV
jgi:hypothetical protein